MEGYSFQPRKWYRKIDSWLIHEFVVINRLAWPTVIASFGTPLIPLLSLFFTGHIGAGVYLDGAALALSFANVTGTSIVIGISSGMDTLCSQAYGGKNYRLVGVYFQRAILLSLLVCFPIWALWLNAESILILLHQDVAVAAIAGKYLRILCVAKPAVILFILSTKFLQAQNVVVPTIFLTGLGNAVNIGCHYLFVIHLGFGVEGSAISISLAYWSLAIMYVVYIRCSSLYHTSWPGWTIDSFQGWLHYCKYGIPGLFMLCLEWWTFEIGYLVVGATSANPKIELGIYSIMFYVSEQLYSVSIGYTIAATVRVGNLLGANDPNLARRVAYLSMCIILVIGVHFSVGVFLLRSYLPFLFTKDSCIIAGASKGLFITAIYENFDGFQLMTGGILKGCGRQGTASVTNLFIYQFIAAPLAICLSVVLKMASRGYWIGMASGIFLQAIIYLALVLCTNWRRVADTAQQNIGLTQHETESTDSPTRQQEALLSTVRTGRRVRYQDLIKLIVVAVFLASFVVGLGLSLKSHHTTQDIILISNNSTHNTNSTEFICPY